MIKNLQQPKNLKDIALLKNRKNKLDAPELFSKYTKCVKWCNDMTTLKVLSVPAHERNAYNPYICTLNR